ncbi:MAG: sigma 54-interacting transcriptional regulator [Polyangiaceae bacterium]
MGSSEGATTDVHRGPRPRAGAPRRPALVCAFPVPRALPFPESGEVVGRAWLETHDLADGEVSGSHLAIDRRGGRLTVTDLGSKNGTWVDGQRLVPKEPVALEEGSRLRLGRTLFVVRHGLRGDLAPAPPLGELVGPYGLRALAEALAGLSRQRPDNVLITGETGAGKELCARAVAAILRPDKPYAAVNAAALSEGVFESQLFGHVEGAFSGAGKAQPGLFVAHDGGTLFLDEIGELELEQQAKLLRVLDNREVLAVGASKPRHVDLSFVAATNRDLPALVEAGSFRADLFARLRAAHLEVPPLRDRVEDLLPILRALAERAGAPLDEAHVEVEAVERLLGHDWPRNVRELANVLAAARRADPSPGLSLWSLEDLIGEAVPRALTEAAVEAAIEASGGNLSRAAAELGISRGKLLRFRKRKA